MTNDPFVMHHLSLFESPVWLTLSGDGHKVLQRIELEHKLGRDVRAAWPWAQHYIAPIMAGDGSIPQLIKHELYRLGALPELGGGMPSPHQAPSFPGGIPERLEFMLLPDKIAPLDAKLAEASKLASRIMRTGRSTNHVEPQPAAPNGNGAATVVATASVPPGNGAANGHAAPVADNAPVERTAQQIELSRLLLRQNELAMLDTPEAEAEYALNGAAIAALSA
jgi:hypothetical protein